jgi:hypothetical protein
MLRRRTRAQANRTLALRAASKPAAFQNCDFQLPADSPGAFSLRAVEIIDGIRHAFAVRIEHTAGATVMSYGSIFPELN